MNCKIYAMGRNEQKAKNRFAYCFENPLFSFFPHDINLPITGKWDSVEYVLHLASNTHPKAYSTDPIGTITTNIIGVKNMLDFSVQYHAKRFAFASSNEIYGENRGDQELFDENYCGYIDCNTMRVDILKVSGVVKHLSGLSTSKSVGYRHSPINKILWPDDVS